MRLHPSLATIFFVAALTAVASYSAAARLDRPTLLVSESSRTSVTLEVTAGASGAPAGFTLYWMKQSDFLAGGWAGGGRVHSSTFYGFPTYNLVDGLPTYALPSNATQVVEAGDLFDETGAMTTSTAELEPNTEYVFRVAACSDGINQASEYSPTIEGATTASNNCTYTQGYWKTHPEAWPVSSMLLGSVSYTKTQLLQIFNQPARGNGLVILAHQLIAAKLNIYQGADPSPIAASVAAADAMIGGLVVPPIGGGFLAPTAVNSDAQALDQYNNGNAGVPHCGTVPARKSTWGALKAGYR